MTPRIDRISSLRTALAQVKAVLEGEPDTIACLANVSAILKTQCDYWWVGFYLVRGEELVLGPFQGPVACTRIAHGRGVCGTAWASAERQVVPDVHAFEGHIACSAESASEVVVPISEKGVVRMVLDIDSRELDDFPEQEVALISEIVTVLEGHLYPQTTA